MTGRAIAITTITVIGTGGDTPAPAGIVATDTAIPIIGIIDFASQRTVLGARCRSRAEQLSVTMQAISAAQRETVILAHLGGAACIGSEALTTQFRGDTFPGCSLTRWKGCEIMC